MIHVAEIRDAAELDGIRLLWRSLWQRTRSASFLQSFKCFESYCRHFGPAHEIKVLVATLAAKPIGIMPLVIRRRETVFGDVRTLTYPVIKGGISYGPIGPNTAATLIAVMRHLRDNRRDWDVIDLHQVGVNQLDRGRTRNALRSAGMNHLTQPGRAESIVELDRNWTDYWSKRSLESRRAFHQSERQLEQRGKLEFVRIRPAENQYGNIDGGWDRVEPFVTSGNSAGATSSAERDYLCDVQALAARRGSTDVGLLQLDGRSIAAAYGYVVDGRVDLLGLEAVPELRDDARRVLGDHMLQDGACRGDESYRFAPHLRSLTREWETGAILTERLTHFAPTAPRAQLLRLNRSMQSWWGTLRQATAALNF